MKAIAILIPLLIVTSSLSSEMRPVPDITAREIIEKVQARYADIKDAVIEFSQSVRFKVSRAEQSSSGKLFFKKKNKYRIETEGRTVVTDGITSWAYNSQNKQVIVDTYKEESHTLSPEQLMLKYPNDFYSVLVGEEKIGTENTYVLKLTPKDESNFATSMKIWVGHKWFIRKVEIVDINGAVTTYSIKSIAVDTGIADSKFTFEIPANAEVLDLR